MRRTLYLAAFKRECVGAKMPERAPGLLHLPLL